MSEFRQGRTAAAEELFVRFGPKLFGIGLRYFHDADLASALVEGTFVKMWHRASRYASTSLSLEGWVVSQALGVALQMSRSHAAPLDHEGPMEWRRSDDAFPVRA
jgi:RNA polymerase sigma-70 factor (ECF subfamily)